jgi:antitoxin component HigA of HigAB toxin-antitoxin module
MKVRELGALLGVSESAASMILKGDRSLTVGHVRKLAARFKVSAGLFVG